MSQTWVNNLSTNITNSLSAASGAGTITVPTGVAAMLNAAGLSASKPAVMTLTQPTGTSETSWEIVAVTAATTGATDTLTVTRAWETSAGVTAGGTGLAWPAGSKLEMRITAGGQRATPAVAVDGYGNVTALTTQTGSVQISEFINVLNFGADATGTNDSTAAIQLAFNYAVAIGKVRNERNWKKNK